MAQKKAVVTEPIKAYKGFNEDLICRGFQFVLGGEYEEKKAARDKGAAKPASSDTKKRTAKNLLTDLEILFGASVTEDIPQSVRNLTAKIEEYLDGDVGVQGLKNGFLRNCKED